MRTKILSLLMLSVPVLSFSKGFYIGKPEEYEKALRIQKEFDYIILNIKGLGIAQFPLYSSLHLINEIYLHPLFSSTIFFREGWQVVKAQASFKTVQFRIYKNALIVQPPFDFRGGTIDVLLRRNDKEMLIKLLCFQTPRKGIFFPYLIFVDRKVLSPDEVFEKYFKLFRKIPDKEVEIYINGITYFIKPVKEFGNLNYKGEKFLIGVRKLEPNP
jgi:hypothetical protein